MNKMFLFLHAWFPCRNREVEGHIWLAAYRTTDIHFSKAQCGSRVSQRSRYLIQKPRILPLSDQCVFCVNAAYSVGAAYTSNSNYVLGSSTTTPFTFVVTPPVCSPMSPSSSLLLPLYLSCKSLANTHHMLERMLAQFLPSCALCQCMTTCVR